MTRVMSASDLNATAPMYEICADAWADERRPPGATDRSESNRSNGSLGSADGRGHGKMRP